jgi:hypothetical protein
MADTNQTTHCGLTLRSFVVAIVAMFVMGVWIEYEELYNYVGGPIAENSPPNSAVGVIACLLVIGGLLYKFRGALRLVTAELVVIYAALVLSAPLMTQGMWHRFFALAAAVPHNQDWKSYQSLPPMLWPHGDNLCPNSEFKEKLDGFKLSGDGTVTWENAKITDTETLPTPVLSNAGKAKAHTALQWTIDRFDKSGHEVLVPGETFLFSMLVKTENFDKDSSYFVRMQADDGLDQPLILNTSETTPTFALPGGFQRVGVNPVKIPTELKSHLTFQVGLGGGGQILVQDLQFFNDEAVEGAYAGRRAVTRAELAKLDPGERSFTVIRPDHWFSWAGLKYVLDGYIPLHQWKQPAIAWSTLVGGLFIGFLGLNLLMRKQWVEHERFTFPLTILPKSLFDETTTPDGQTVRPIMRNAVMWTGFGITLFLCLLKGIHYYQPRVPAPDFKINSFADYVNNPVFKKYLAFVGIGTGSQIGLSLGVLAISLLIETDILFSLWSMFLIYQLWNLFGYVFNLGAKYPGYPWDPQQTMGGFIAYALIALIVGRHHLVKVCRLMAGGEVTDGTPASEIKTYRFALLLVLASLGTLAVWGIWTKMGMTASLFFFGYMLVCGFAASKIRAECGAPFGGLTPYIGMQFMTACGGFAVFKSTAMLVTTLASGFMCTTVFLLIAPVQVEMMELGRHFRVRPRDIGAGLTLGLVGGLFIGGFVLMCWMYGFGAVNQRTAVPYEQNYYFNNIFRPGDANADRALATHTLGKTPELQPLNIAKNPDAKGLAIGAGITGVLAFMRMKFMWFPFHPLGYVLASTYFMRNVWFTLFLAWLARLVVFRVGGAQVIRRGLVPACVGMFMACVASVIFFDAVGIYLRLHGVVDVYCKMP